MKPLRLLLFLAFLIAFPAYAQEFRTLQKEDYQKYWETGPLTFSDFSGKPANSETGSYLAYKLGSFPEKKVLKDTTIYRFAAYSYVDRNQSWLVSGDKNEQALKYQQAVFNLVEIHERMLQAALYRLSDQDEAEPITAQAFEILKKEAADWASKTSNGKNAAAVQQFISETEQRLTAQPAPHLPAFHDRKVRYGFHGGVGYTFVAGDLNTYFQNPINLVLGIEAGYKKVLFHFNATQGFSEVKNAFTEDHIWPADIRVSVNYFEASLGYHLVNSGKFNVIPFAGWSLIQFNASDRSEVYKYNELSEHTYNAGICLDYKVRHRFNFIPGYFGKTEATETRVRTRLSFSPVNYNDFQQGAIVTLSASLCFGGRLFKVE